MSYITGGYWNWLGSARSEMGDERGTTVSEHQSELDAMLHGRKCPLSLWDENRRLYMDNLRLWDCLTLIRSDPSMTCQGAINLVFSLRDSEYLISFPDTHQLMLLRYPAGFVAHSNVDDAKLENHRLKDENARLHAAIWVLRDNPSLQADSTVAAIFRLDEAQFQAKFHVEVDIPSSNLFKVTDKQMHHNNNKVIMASLDIGSEPNMAIQLTNKPIKVGATFFRRCRSASGRRQCSSDCFTPASCHVTRKRSGSSIHQRNMSTNWKTARLLPSDRLYFLPEEDIHANLYNKRSPRGCGQSYERHMWYMEDDKVDLADIATDFNNSHTSAAMKQLVFSNISAQKLEESTTDSDSAESAKIAACGKSLDGYFLEQNYALNDTTNFSNCGSLLADATPLFRKGAYQMSNTGRDWNCPGDQSGLPANEKETISSSSETDYTIAKKNTNQNMKDNVPVPEGGVKSLSKDPFKSYTKKVGQHAVLDSKIKSLRPSSIDPHQSQLSPLDKKRLEPHKLKAKASSDLSNTCSRQDTCHQGVGNDGGRVPRTARPLTAKSRDFQRFRRQNLNCVAKWNSLDTTDKEECSKRTKNENLNVSKAVKSGVSFNNNTMEFRKNIKYAENVDIIYSKSNRTLSGRKNSASPTIALSRISLAGQTLLAPTAGIASTPEIGYSVNPASFRPPRWQPYSFHGFNSVKHFLDRQRWLMDGENLIKSDKTFFTRAISPSMYGLGEEDYLTSKRHQIPLVNFSPILSADYLRMNRRGTKVWPHSTRRTSGMERKQKAIESLRLSNLSHVEAGNLKECDNPNNCTKKNKKLKSIYELGKWKYTKPLADMLQRNMCSNALIMKENNKY